MENVLLQMNNIGKHFAGVYALKGINFNLKAGEVHAILGENGAGKSTLIKVLGGIYKPDAGEIIINGSKVEIDSVNKANSLGIGIIHQEIVLVPYLTAAENIFLGREIQRKHFFIDKRKMFFEAQKLIDALGVKLDARSLVGTLTIAQQQVVGIIKALSFNSKILVMDEPTSSLTRVEVEQLFDAIYNVTSKGIGVIYISHRLEEIFKIADRVTVIRDGNNIGTKFVKDVSTSELISMMVGRTWGNYYVRNFNNKYNETIFRTKEITKKGVFQDVTFSVGKGEVVGFSGLVGAGRSEVMSCVYGADSFDSGEMELLGKRIRFKAPSDASDNGIALVPENRKKQGLIIDNTIEFNLTLSSIKSLLKHFFIDKETRASVVQKYIAGLNIRTSSITQIVKDLSGGNQQKVVIAKALATNPKLLILDEPTRGIDVGAKKEIYSIIDQLAKDGMAIILVSSELPEIINMCDRVYVMANGKIKAELKREELSEELIMKYATEGVVLE